MDGVQSRQAPFELSIKANNPGNIAICLPRMAALHGGRRAVILSATNYSINFHELERLSNRYANGLVNTGIGRGTRTLLMVRPGVEFVALVFALFKIGAVPVMIDPGMGVSRLLDCVRQVEIEAFIGVPVAQVVRIFRRSAFASVKQVIIVGRRYFLGGHTLNEISDGASEHFEVVDTKADEVAAILFTSGSTGPAKGVVYEHGMFEAQVRMIQAEYGIEAGEVDLPTFPLFALFSVAMGMSIVIPEMDASRPGQVDPAKIVRAVRDHQVTNTFGSPAVWRKVAPYCVERKIKLPSLRRILIAGAPVPDAVIEQLHQVLRPDADVYTPYGATESLPVSSISGKERLAIRGESSGRIACGTCVGRAVVGAEVRIIRISDEPIDAWNAGLELNAFEVGEIAVAGEAVTRQYWNLPAATRGSKIADGDNIWHRIGDVGYFDDGRRLWFCGRKAHRVITERGAIFTECIEPVFNQHPEVARSALVGIGEGGRKRAVVIIEAQSGRVLKGEGASSLKATLRSLISTKRADYVARDGLDAVGQSQLQILGDDYEILFHRSLPVDVRHNAKINRELLAVWACQQCGELRREARS